jgi:RimJ/RimL family protein N-acetyltransferase
MFLVRHERSMIETARLVLRPWRKSDLPLFAEQNADPVVMRFLGGVLTREESDAYVRRAERHLAEAGFCKWAVEAPGVAPLIGAVGLTRVTFEASFTPAVEVAWREIVSMAALANTASTRVMERLGMTRSIEFDHPRLSEGSPLRRHVLYRLRGPTFAAPT